MKEGKITHSLYKTAEKFKNSNKLNIEFARIYGFQVDFEEILENDLPNYV